MSCDNEAVALLTFAPQQAKAWLYDLHEANPNGGIMLCRKHANATVVPMSWQLVDARDPAWPGPAVEVVEAAAPARDHAAPAPDPTPADEAGLDAAMGLPSDAATDRAFAALDGPLPVTPQPYHEPRAATLRAAGVTDVATIDAEATDADLSLFQLPLADVPAVTPHPDYH